MGYVCLFLLSPFCLASKCSYVWMICCPGVTERDEILPIASSEGFTKGAERSRSNAESGEQDSKFLMEDGDRVC